VAYLLVVDDHADTRDSLCAYLRKFGHDVAGAANGDDAITAILGRLPDLMILDLYMPQMDGAGLLDVLRSYSRLQSLPVIVWTAYPDSPMIARARKLGVTEFLTKGTTDFDDILAAVNREMSNASSPNGRPGSAPGLWH
jgi:two-component system chemotaxis response regulator CheY